MNDYTECACGCGSLIPRLDKRGRQRKFVVGHANYQKIAKYILPDYKICNACKQSLPINSFDMAVYVSKINDEECLRPRSKCRDCEAKIAREYTAANKDKRAEAKKKHREKYYGTIKYHVQQKISAWRKASAVQSDLTVDYLIDLYNRQNGLCYYSGEKMIFGWIDGKVNHNSLSLDKLDPSKGYVQGNVRWCTYLANTMKQDLTEQEFYSHIRSILNVYDTRSK
jgi:hypothetical protein